MTTPLDHILIFKTNILTAADRLAIENRLNTHCGIERWSLDQQDVDCVLRIVSATLTPADIIDLITCQGFACAELD
ncbi:hypothetical protein BN8_00139 [Fibrisoma limi BUZ 3]|uniref:Uncharacterized protein n=1 Tax=Fibrisoma limi BUZ 3 TaxID=1185876 RepID=I2GBF0_9BACT|nr:hypothetical protein [Fibrisoma limi]CCH51224.1 hypothetical protein BN8_00139 [Fibrisoma limi BUZ 3]